MDDRKILPCPCCGNVGMDYYDVFGSCQIECAQCGLGTNMESDRQEAISIWNRRS